MRISRCGAKYLRLSFLFLILFFLLSSFFPFPFLLALFFVFLFFFLFFVYILFFDFTVDVTDSPPTGAIIIFMWFNVCHSFSLFCGFISSDFDFYSFFLSFFLSFFDFRFKASSFIYYYFIFLSFIILSFFFYFFFHNFIIFYRSEYDDCPVTVTPSPVDQCKAGSVHRVFSKPDNCAQFYNCSLPRENPRPGYLGDYIDECPYPKLFSERTKKCENFTTVNCGSRKEIKYACKYFH
ncbi:unnamed protein product [Acanthosepion pharaonis]|uniref:Chitin-binding type-2 domain-containing protein n=1 Tax=Acanthosepion pharaonis TaxID=158019 RepID=A0A812C2R8_ACAPH|nr:unnamed protein product [Sepia pharaonis]